MLIDLYISKFFNSKLLFEVGTLIPEDLFIKLDWMSALNAVSRTMMLVK